ncbi:MAG: ribulose-phosphate 3-epimerase [Candidatus Ancillula sp.]|nr:ribulose-phosphate 3-epimerase [Candidatus Ancillula sp.]
MVNEAQNTRQFKESSSFGIAPSILSCDFANFEGSLNSISTADFAHIDVMDYHFVPNLTFGGPVVERLIEVCKGIGLKSDVHLMIDNPDVWAVDYAKFGADSVTFHYQAAAAPIRLARELRSLGSSAAIAVRPAEPVEPLFDILDEFDMILVMTVEPGFGGQKFLANQMDKVRRLRSAIDKLPQDKRPILQVDGGVSRKTVEEVAAAGANLAVAGSAVYGAEDAKREISVLREMGDKAFRMNNTSEGAVR